jgi:hypothetical protein
VECARPPIIFLPNDSEMGLKVLPTHRATLLLKIITDPPLVVK